MIAAVLLVCACGLPARAIRINEPDTQPPPPTPVPAPLPGNFDYLVLANDSIDALVINVDGNRCTGLYYLLWTADGQPASESFRMMDCTFMHFGRGNDYMEFTLEGTDRAYYAWMSDGGYTLSGHFSENGIPFPWAAVKKSFFMDVAREGIPESGYLFLTNDSSGVFSLDNVSGGACSGSMVLWAWADGSPIREQSMLRDCMYSHEVSESDYIEFKRDTVYQNYSGLISSGGALIAGHYYEDRLEYPWLAMDPGLAVMLADRLFGIDAPMISMEPGSPPPAPAPGASIVNKTTGRTYKDLQQAVYDAGDGETISLAPGDFYLSTPLDIYEKNNLTIIGAGRDKTRVLLESAFAVVLHVYYSRGVTIRDMYLTHDVPFEQSCSYGVIEMNNVSDVTIVNNELVGSGYLGIMSYAGSGFLRIENNIIRDNQTAGIEFNDTDESVYSKLTLKNNTIVDNGAAGVDCVYGCDGLARMNVEASGNEIARNAGGDFAGLPAEFERALGGHPATGPGKGPGKEPGWDPGQDPPPVVEVDPGGDTAAALAKRYGVDATTLANLIAESDSLSVLSEYKDSPEILALKLKHLEYINSHRRNHGRSDIELDVAVSRLANYHSYDMVYNNYFAHDSQDGSSPWDRAERYGIGIWAENLAMPGGVGDCSNMTPEVFLDRAKTSTDLFMAEGPGGGHYENMLGDHHTGVGFGLMCYDGRVTYTEDFR